MREQVKISWEAVFKFVDTLPNGLVYGVPRGGAILAGIAAARNPDIKVVPLSGANYVLDDIVDSGATKEKHEALGCRFEAMHMKDPDDDRWVVYPWEGRDPVADNEDTVIRQLELIGEDPNREGLRDTPKRYLKAMQEMTQGYHLKASEVLSTTFAADGYDELVYLKNINFTSLCEHHLLPFSGRTAIAYIPTSRLVGLSKLARLVDMHAQRLQIQEKMTNDIKKDLVSILKPKGAAVLIEAHHSCMGCRGAKKPEAIMGTSALSGLFKNDHKARAEVMELLK